MFYKDYYKGAVMNKPKIFVFSATGGGDGICYALAEDGAVLGSHYCSDEYFAKGDLGVDEGSRSDRHETYAKHYPDGYEMEFVPVKDLNDHEGVTEAIRLNHLQGEKSETEDA